MKPHVRVIWRKKLFSKDRLNLREGFDRLNRAEKSVNFTAVFTPEEEGGGARENDIASAGNDDGDDGDDGHG